MSEVKVKFKTITPLWTGDAWMKNCEIRPSSIIGSLRFWFEVICYFTGITTDNDYENGKLKANITSDKFKKEFLELKNQKPYKNEHRLKDMVLAKLGVPLPARIFGCTGWKSLIKIKNIDNNHNNIYGNFQITFEIEQNLVNSIFYPLLNFIDKYGFLGEKWNKGYGRIKILSIKNNGQKLNILDNCKEFCFGQFCKYKYEKDKKDKNKIVLDGCYEDKGFNDIIDNKTNFMEKIDLF